MSIRSKDSISLRLSPNSELSRPSTVGAKAASLQHVLRLEGTRNSGRSTRPFLRDADLTRLLIKGCGCPDGCQDRNSKL